MSFPFEIFMIIITVLILFIITLVLVYHYALIKGFQEGVDFQKTQEKYKDPYESI